jgi:tetratricopeptide (TPR) repeat protein
MPWRNTKKLISLNPENARILYELGKMYFRARKFQPSADAFRQVTNIEPDHSAAYYNMGGALQALRKYNEAANAFKSAINIRPDYATAHYALGQLYLQQRKLDLARSPLEEAVRSRPQAASTPGLALGSVYFNLGQYPAAEEEYLAALAMAANRADINHNLANTLLAKGDSLTGPWSMPCGLRSWTIAQACIFIHLRGCDRGGGGRRLGQEHLISQSISLDASYLPPKINLAAILEAEGRPGWCPGTAEGCQQPGCFQHEGQ